MVQTKTTLLRKLSMYGFDLVAGSHNFYALLEFDITNLRNELRKQRVTGTGGSLFAFLLKAIGHCLKIYPVFNSMIDLRKTTTFEDVDINIPIELEKDGTYYTKQYIIKNITSKSLSEITTEIELSKQNANDEKSFVFSKTLQFLIDILPRFIVRAIFKSQLISHKRIKNLSGTVFVTSVSMFTNASGFIIPYIGGPKASSFAIGSSVKKPVVNNSEIVIREIINITATFNHDIIDGAPAARFRWIQGPSATHVNNHKIAPLVL